MAKATNRQYAQAIQLTTEKRKLNNINVDSLQEQSQTLEKQLIAALPALQSVIATTGFTGKQVVAKFKPKEAVVHWVSFQYKSPKQWTDSTLYAAYIITPKDTAPKFVTVFEEKQLQALLKNYHGGSGRSTIKKDNNSSNNDHALYQLIWQPLLPYLQGATTVYNLPSGLLHKISFAALTDSTNKSLIEQYELHQLLSINELVNPLQISTPAKTIALFGGANYNVAANTTSTNYVATPPMYRNATNNKTIQFNYLQGTKTEVETVAANAKNTNWKVQTYTNTNASEDNFKNLSGENAPKILHIATHGFYFPPTKTKPTNFITEDKNTPKDFPLLRSGLVLSGVNNYWGKDTLLENKEDGIVTAQEISNLNLLNTDLVVLSACQTALGDINGSEGVYGLQRAFKMAGVKKLLMSLWEVPDAETAELMQLFYSNVFKGETYYTAFRKAQLALKAKYKDPTKWAGFVLVGE
jgi:CHAT domain-containing protein